MARTLAQIQTTLGLLQTQYDTLAASAAQEISAEGRALKMNQLKLVREEIQVLEGQEAALEAAENPGVAAAPGVSYAKFEQPKSGH